MDSSDELVELFKKQDNELVEKVRRLRHIASVTLMDEKKVKIDAVRRAVLVEDLKCQEAKLKLIDEVLAEVEEKV